MNLDDLLHYFQDFTSYVIYHPIHLSLVSISGEMFRWFTRDTYQNR